MHEVKKSSVNYVKKNMDHAVKTDLIINFKKVLNILAWEPSYNRKLYFPTEPGKEISYLRQIGPGVPEL